MAKIPFGATVTAKVRWFGDARLAELMQKAGRGTVKATNAYSRSLVATLKRTPHGSEPFSGFGEQFVGPRVAGRGKRIIHAGNLRVRVRHSKPGRPPLAQTFNLANSIRTSFNFKRAVAFTSKSRVFKIRSRISTDVPYAISLERGTPMRSIPQTQKKHTSIRLINPIKPKSPPAARPVWLPLFERLHPRMVGMIAKEIRRGGFGRTSLSGNFEIT